MRGPAPLWPVRDGASAFVLPLAPGGFAGLPGTLALPECRLERKREFHLTVLSSSEAAAVASGPGSDAVVRLFDRRDWAVRPTGTQWLLRKEGEAGVEWSLVACVACPSLDAFRRDVAAAAGVVLPAPVPHVTLFVSPGSRGIGLASHQDFATRRVRRLA